MQRLISKKTYLAALALFMLLIPAFTVKAQERPDTRTVNYRGIHPDDPGGRCGLSNPERGFRHEAQIGNPSGYNIWGAGSYLKDKVTQGYSDDWFLMNARRYESHGMTLIQGYCYLTDYCDKPISEEKLGFLQRSLDRCREAGLKVLLRFAYERNMEREKGPSTETILAHLDQLAPVIRRNKDVIYVFQAGFVGAWGEWHSSTNYIEENHSDLAEIIKKEIQILPEDRMIQLRVMPRYKRWVLEDTLLDSAEKLDSANAFSGTPASRLGFANDGFMAEGNDGGTWPEPPFYASPSNPEFDRITMESPYMAVDGELFWSDQGGKIDGLKAALRMRLHHYTSFSFTHSYSGYEGKRYSIDNWMEMPVSEEDIRAAKLPLSDGYFRNYNGETVARTAFDYIRDHLGYRIELQSATFTGNVSKGATLKFEADLINRGFSTLINQRPVYLVLISSAGEIVLSQKTGADPQSWQPFNPGDPDYKPLLHKISANMPLKETECGEYMLGLWMPDADRSLEEDSRYSVRVANGDVPWWTTADGRYGVNILGRIKINNE